MYASIDFVAKEADGEIVLVVEIKEKRTVSVRLDEELAKWLDAAWVGKYPSRSHFLRRVAELAAEGRLPRPELARSPAVSPPAKTVTFKADSSLVEKLDEAARSLGFGSRSDLLRYALELVKEGKIKV